MNCKEVTVNAVNVNNETEVTDVIKYPENGDTDFDVVIIDVAAIPEVTDRCCCRKS